MWGDLEKEQHETNTAVALWGISVLSLAVNSHKSFPDF